MSYLWDMVTALATSAYRTLKSRWSFGAGMLLMYREKSMTKHEPLWDASYDALES